MNDSIDHLYRRNATERSSQATDSKVLSLARAHARSIRVRRRLGVGVAAAAAMALLALHTFRHEQAADNALRDHYAAVAHPYLLAVKLDPAVASSVDSSRPADAESQ